MREQQAQIVNIISGPTELFLVDPQQDEHTRGYRFHLYMADQRKRCAAMRDEALKIIARRRADEVALEAAE